MSDHDESVFWAEFIAAGFLKKVRVKPTGAPLTDVYVRWDEPNNNFLGAQSKDYQIEYQHSDIPTLSEGDAVTKLDDAGNPISKEKYKVRETPFVNANPADSQSGFFRHALLTKLL